MPELPKVETMPPINIEIKAKCSNPHSSFLIHAY